MIPPWQLRKATKKETPKPTSSRMIRLPRHELARLIRLAESRMGQPVALPAGDPLLSVPVIDILNRVFILPFMTENLKAFYVNSGNQGDLGSMATVPDSSKNILFPIAANPTNQQLQDIGFLDSLFGIQSSTNLNTFYPNKATMALCSGEIERILGAQLFGYINTQINWRTGGAYQFKAPDGTSYVLDKLAGNPFFCPPNNSGWPPSTLSIWWPPQTYFNLDTSKTLGDSLTAIQNVETFLQVTGSYQRPDLPQYGFPSVVSIHPLYFYSINQKALQDLVNSGHLVDADDIRLWLTLTIISQWSQLASDAQHTVQQMKNDARQNAIIVAVGLTIAGGIIGFGIAALAPVLGLIATTAIKAVVGTGIGVLTTEQKNDAAKGLSAIASQLQSTDPQFAAEVTWAQNYLNQHLGVSITPTGGVTPTGGGTITQAPGSETLPGQTGATSTTTPAPIISENFDPLLAVLLGFGIPLGIVGIAAVSQGKGKKASSGLVPGRAPG